LRRTYCGDFAYRSETQYHEVLKNYFKNAASSGAYLVAEMYCEFIASLPNSGDGMIDTPNKFNELEFGSDSYKRVRGALSDINDKAGKKVFDFLHDRVIISSARVVSRCMKNKPF